MPELQTERLLLQPLTWEDAPDLNRITGDPEVMRYSITGPDRNLEATVERIAALTSVYESFGFDLCATRARENGKLVGLCGLKRTDDGRIEVGYRIRRDQWGKGYAREAAARWLAYGFESLNVSTIIALIEPANTASVRVAEGAWHAACICGDVPRQVCLDLFASKGLRQNDGAGSPARSHAP